MSKRAIYNLSTVFRYPDITYIEQEVESLDY